jgi:uncharacterized protein
MSETRPDNLVILRAHHLLCLHGFRGLGYDDRFVANMSEVCERIRREPAPQIKVVNEPDDICGACPHVTGCSCEKTGEVDEERARQLDARVLAQLGIAPGQIFARDELMTLIYNKITPDDLVVVCEGCDWLPFDYCAEGLEMKRVGKE